MKSLVAGVFVLVLTAPAGSVLAQGTPGSLRWALRLNETRGPIRTADTSSLPGKDASSEILGGPANGSDNAYLIYTRMPAGARGPALFTLPVEHYYVVLSGRMTVQIGTDTFIAGPMTGVVIPMDTPHAVWNAGAEPEAHLEVIAPAPSRELMSMLKPGATTILYGADRFKASKNVMPERHLTLLLPQNVDGPADIEFEMKDAR